MLETDYKDALKSRMDLLDWNIELPEDAETFFRQGGLSGTTVFETRAAARLRVRGRGILYFESSLPALPRNEGPLPIYTTDFSRVGVGLISACQIFPEETVRILLPSVWIRVRIVRCRRVCENCFHTGGTMIDQYEPSGHAFDLSAKLDALCDSM